MLSLLRVTNFSDYSTAFQEGPHFQDIEIQETEDNMFCMPE